MTSSDLRDVLNLPTDGAGGPRPAKKQKIGGVRPNLKGLAREVQNLGGDNPIAIVPEVSVFKKRRFANRKPAAKWVMHTFKNSAREDNSLILRHWRRSTEGENTAQGAVDQPMANGVDGEQNGDDKTEDSAFAKFNVQVAVPQYSEDQYRANLQHDDWSREETDYLLGLVRDFDLRWPIIWDRYDYMPTVVDGDVAADGTESKAIVPATKPRTMEDLKARYYEVAAKMMAVQKPVQYMTQPEFSLHELMANFNPAQEKLRKEFAAHGLSRSREEAKEEESLLLEIKRILARSDRFNEERRELYNRLDYPHTDQDISSFKSSAGLQTLLQNLMNVDKTKKRKSIAGPEGVSPSGPAAQQAAAQEPANRRESIAASSAGGPGHAHKESVSAVQTPTTGGKKGAQLLERRKLSEHEEHIYGVSHHDRLPSGPTFRYEKINKLFTHKSNSQQLRITNTLNELDIPPRLSMPTAAVTLQFEQLLGAVNTLLDARKVTDKIEAEIKLEMAKKEEREKKNAPPASETKPGDENKDKSAEASKDGKDAATATTDSDSSKATASAQAAPSTDEGAASTGEGNAQVQMNGEEAASAAETKVDAAKDDASGEKDKAARPGSSSASHKRSASVLSTVSDKSSKRQKK
jgi:DNA methyltransferase 1-associated protein 1